MARRPGWTRVGTRRPFRYLDASGARITDPAVIERLDGLAIPPAWREVWIAPGPRAKLQATGLDAAGRRQYIYHPDFRAQQEAAKFGKLIQFAEQLPEIRQAMGEHMMLEPLDPLRVCAIAVRLTNLAWFRVGSDRYAKESRTYGVTTLRKSHVEVRGKRVSFNFRAKHKVRVRTALVDAELAQAIVALKETPGARLFRY
jgi:DNA topoisomerase-1